MQADSTPEFQDHRTREEKGLEKRVADVSIVRFPFRCRVGVGRRPFQSRGRGVPGKEGPVLMGSLGLCVPAWDPGGIC